MTTRSRRPRDTSLALEALVGTCLSRVVEGGEATSRALAEWRRVMDRLVRRPLEEGQVTWKVRADALEPSGAIERFFALQWAASLALSIQVDCLLTRNARSRELTAKEATFRYPEADLPFPRLVDANLSAHEVDAPFQDIERWQRSFHRTIPRSFRRMLGQFHSPEWLVDAFLSHLDEKVLLHGTILDPGCGSGVFPRLVLRRRLACGMDAEKALEGIFGIEIDPLAVLVARYSILLEFLRAGVAPPLDRATPILWGDAILGECFQGSSELPRDVDALVGNPPWIGWDRLSRDYRERLEEHVLGHWHLYENEGFLSHLGGAADDLLHVFTSVTIDRHLAPRGEVLYLVKRTLFDNVTGRDFRRFLLRRRDGRSRPLEVKRVFDLTRLGKIFDDGAGATAGVHLRADAETIHPVPWSRSESRDLEGPTLEARPLDESPGAPWVIGRKGEERRFDLEGFNPYGEDIRHGLKHDAEDVFALDVVAREGDLLVCRREGEGFRLEDTCVFPYLKSRHTRAFAVLPALHVLVPQSRAGEDNETWLAANCPLTYDYLREHEERLAARRSSVYRGRVFYAMFGLGEYTFAPWRVAWCGMGAEPRFVVCSSLEDEYVGPKVPVFDSIHYTIAFDEPEEPHYLAAYLNSRPVRTHLQSRGESSKRRYSKRALSSLRIPRFDPEDAHHRELVEFSRAAHANPAFDEVHLERLVERVLEA